MTSIIKRFVIEHITLKLPQGNTKLEERQINNMVGYIVTTRYLGDDTAEIHFHDAHGRMIEALTLKNGVQRCFFQRPVSMYVTKISIHYTNPARGSDQITVNLSLIGEKKIDLPPQEPGSQNEWEVK